MNKDFQQLKDVDVIWNQKRSRYRDNITGSLVDWYDDDTVLVHYDTFLINNQNNREVGKSTEIVGFADKDNPELYDVHYKTIPNNGVGVEGIILKAQYMDILYLDIDSVHYRFFKQVVGFTNFN